MSIYVKKLCYRCWKKHDILACTDASATITVCKIEIAKKIGLLTFPVEYFDATNFSGVGLWGGSLSSEKPWCNYPKRLMKRRKYTFSIYLMIFHILYHQ